MDFEEIAVLVNQAAIEKKGRPLKSVEHLVLKGAWENKTYSDMAFREGYTEAYLKGDVGPKLWQLLEEIVDVPQIHVTKRNIQSVLQSWAAGTLAATDDLEEESALKLVITRQRKSAQYFTEDLGNGIDLDMVLITGGGFLMGSPDNEIDRWDDEGPQHEVTVPTCFMGKFPITQAQWRVVVETYPQVEQELDPDPANFKGDHRPVEQVSWLDATEFCARLSQKTGREYRLPTEAEWEYACRAGTTTPFAFGETLTSDLVNYNGDSYNHGPQGESRGETTDVGSLPNANQFGLYDMHGNVWEWCQDHWHDNYEGEPPADGRAWLFSDERKDGETGRLLRGGSWDHSPRGCRSACRNGPYPDARDLSDGFRVVCSAARALQ
ncbi:formylglycine-generating enzyme family protein [Nodosilinea sp. LEGE 07088]|uniref:formylglycine-generating enzyme family protein n=1 Tax=Nodosilinea sp. LEGE 07088 TaxID=2777968 RepID=UPI00187DF300|nr:formylglycine-generating enzyme family protein [Nodosilinea sp. LEGE 07088]MBE9140831.1 formylglycine-generating enzyme family protein [Nodosilinea sp. LEGE 07088]